MTQNLSRFGEKHRKHSDRDLKPGSIGRGAYVRFRCNIVRICHKVTNSSPVQRYLSAGGPQFKCTQKNRVVILWDFPKLSFFVFIARKNAVLQ